MSSVRLDLLPRLLRFQFQSDACILRAFPSMEHRYRSLQPLEGWLIQQVTLTLSLPSVPRVIPLPRGLVE